VKATSKAHDKQVALNSNRNFNALQAAKPWASAEEVAAFGRGRGGPKGKPFQNQVGGRPGNDFGPRNNSFGGPGGSRFPTPQRNNNFNNRGNFNAPPKFQRNNPQQQGQQRNNNANPTNQGNANNSNNFNAGGYQQKPRPPNKNFRNGGN
jgi:hypothetical protein